MSSGPAHVTTAQTVAPETSALAIVSLVAGILGLVWFGATLAPFPHSRSNQVRSIFSAGLLRTEYAMLGNELPGMMFGVNQ